MTEAICGATENRCSNRQGAIPETSGTSADVGGESELRIDFGRRYRVYHSIADALVVLSCGGDRTASREACAARERWDQFARDLGRRSIPIPGILERTPLHDRIDASNLNRRPRQRVFTVHQRLENLVWCLTAKRTFATQRFNHHSSDSEDVSALINRTAGEDLRRN